MDSMSTNLEQFQNLLRKMSYLMGNVFYGQIMNYMDKCNKYSYRIKLFSKFLGIDQNLFTLDRIRGHVLFFWIILRWGHMYF